MKTTLLFLLLLLIQPAFSQQIRGLYVNGFSDILGDTEREDSLLRFAENNGFNYLTLYEMHIVHANSPLTSLSSSATFANFVQKAKTQYNIAQIGVASENFNAFNDVYHVYNQQHPTFNQRIDVYNLEFEFWVPSSTDTGGVYCDYYLEPAGIPCDTAGAFSYFVPTLHKIDSLAALDDCVSEVYFGWFNQGQGAQIVQTGVDRILLSAYIPTPSYSQANLHSYLSDRLERLASANQQVKILPLFSAEDDFMQAWAVSNPFFPPYDHFTANISSETDPWAQYIDPEGIQWFAYSFMPKKNMDLSVSSDGYRNIAISPNPSNGTVEINSQEILNQLVVSDLNGNIVAEFHSSNQVQLKNLTSGVYFVTFNTKSGSGVRKCVVF